MQLTGVCFHPMKDDLYRMRHDTLNHGAPIRLDVALCELYNKSYVAVLHLVVDKVWHEDELLMSTPGPFDHQTVPRLKQMQAQGLTTLSRLIIIEYGAHNCVVRNLIVRRQR